MRTSEAYYAAADHIATYGLQKRGYGNAGEPACGLGALALALWGHTSLSASLFLHQLGSLPARALLAQYDLARTHLDCQMRERGFRGWVAFNDDMRTSAEDVILELKTAGKISEENGD
jgi:hypothetical protein